MISLTCANCQASLEVDDAFAGGVCRCQHCGTIQTVPKAGAAQKTLYKQRQRPESIGSGTGLDDLANIVTSSGLNSGRLRRPREDSGRKKFVLILSAAGALILLLLGVVGFLLTRGDDPGASHSVTSVPQAPQQKTVEPNFAGIPISEQTVIYVLDRGDASKDSFGYLKTAALQSVATLGAGRRFQIIFWNNGSDFSFPLGSPIGASPENLNAAKKALDDIDAFGKTTIKTALEKATLNNPQVVFIASAKAWDLDEAFAAEVVSIRGTNRYKIHTLAIGDSGTSTALKTIAEKSGGQYLAIEKSSLREMANP